MASHLQAAAALLVSILTAPMRLLALIFARLFVAPLEPGERFHGPPHLADAEPAAGPPGPPPDGRGPAVSFGGCGFMYPWQLGVARFINEAFDTSAVRTAGHSAGFASALTVSSGVPVEAHWHALQVCELRWRSRMLGPFLDSTEHWMRPYTAELQPHAKRILEAAADGRLHIGYTRIRFRPGRLPWIVAGHAVKADFASIREFVYTVTVSQRIVPFYRRPGHLHGAWGLDGAFSGGFTLPPGVARQHAVCVSPVNPFADVRPAEPPPLTAVVAFPTRQRWDRLYAEGYEDAKRAAGVFLQRGFALRVPAAVQPAAELRLAAHAQAPAGAEEAHAQAPAGAPSASALRPRQRRAPRAAAAAASPEPSRDRLAARAEPAAWPADAGAPREAAQGTSAAAAVLFWPARRVVLEVSAAADAVAGACRATSRLFRARLSPSSASAGVSDDGDARARARGRGRSRRGASAAASKKKKWAEMGASPSPPPKGRRQMAK